MLFYIIGFVIIIGTFIATNYRYENYGLGDTWLWLFFLMGVVNTALIVTNIYQKLHLWQLKRQQLQLDKQYTNDHSN